MPEIGLFVGIQGLTFMLRSLKPALIPSSCLFFLSFCLFIAGCGVRPSTPPSISGTQLQGHVHGGQQPVSGSTIQLYAAGTSGYGEGAIALLANPIITDSSGSFSITAQYQCPSSSSQLYIVATGGNPGLGSSINNTSLALMAALGPCSLYGGQLTLDPNSFITINEATTVASVYALAGFMDPVSSQIGATSINAVGIANAFQTVTNLVDVSTGQSPATTSAGNGTVPQATINTLANIVSACVNSSGTGTQCSSLFSATTPSGGIAPTNTLQAVYNLATHPAQQVATLFALTPSAPPFQPALASAPNDWTLALNFTGGLSNPASIAIDSSGDIWIANNGNGTVTELANTGVVLSGSVGYPTGITYPHALAIDPGGDVWVAGFGSTGNIVKMTSSGALLSGSTGFPAAGLDAPDGIAIDGTGSAWVTNWGGSTPVSVLKFANDGTVLSGSNGQGFTSPYMNSPFGVAIDAAGDAWVADPNLSNLVKFDTNGQVLSGSGNSGFVDYGLFQRPEAIAIDSTGNAWIVNVGDGNISKFSNSGAGLSGAINGLGFIACIGTSDPNFSCNPYISPAIVIDGSGNAWYSFTYNFLNSSDPNAYYAGFAEMNSSGTVVSGQYGYNASLSSYPTTMAIDSSGNVWGADLLTNVVIELIGAATPVVTPLSVGVKTGTLGTRP